MSFEQAVVRLEQTNAALQEEVVRFRDAAMGLNAIYPTITEGRQAVADGKYFSVPGNGAYMRLYRRTGSSASLIAEFPDRAQVQGIVDAFAGRGVVGGPGDLMAERAYGLGSPVGPDFNADDLGLKTQLGRFTGGTPDGANWFGLHFSRVLDAQSAQLAIRDGSSNMAAVRGRGSNGVWRDWSQLYHNHNIVGTVSQSGGVPTGAIIERGINGNGEYIKLADGTLICLKIYTSEEGIFCDTPDGPLFRTNQPLNWQFPHGFATAPHVWGSSRTARITWVKARPLSSSNGEAVLVASVAFSVPVSIELIAMGRWY